MTLVINLPHLSLCLKSVFFSLTYVCMCLNNRLQWSLYWFMCLSSIFTHISHSSHVSSHLITALSIWKLLSLAWPIYPEPLFIANCFFLTSKMIFVSWCEFLWKRFQVFLELLLITIFVLIELSLWRFKQIFQAIFIHSWEKLSLHR